MGILRTIARNALSNAAGYLVSVVTALVLTPFVIHHLGKSVWGFWSLVVSFTGYYGILDLGIRSAVGQYVTRYWAQRDMDGVNRTLNTALILTGAVGLLLLGVTILMVPLAPGLFQVRGPVARDFQWAILIMGVSVSLSFPLAVFGSATFARQRFDIANAIGISEKILWAFLTIWVLKHGKGLVGLAGITGGLSLLSWGARMVVAFKLLPGLSLSPAFFSKASVKELWNFGIFNFLVNAADRIVLNTDAFVIGLVMATPKDPALAGKAIAYYNVGANPIFYALAVTNSVAWTLTPYATSCDSRGQRDALKNLWLAGTRLIFLMAAVLTGGMIFLGSDFLSVWVGPDFVSGKEFVSSAAVMAVLAVAALARSGMSCGKQVLFGMREVKFLAFISMGEAVANLGLSLVLIHYYGILGVALGTLIPILVTQLWIQPLFLSRRLGEPLRDFLKNVTPGGLAAMAVMGLLSLPVHRWIQVENWGDFILAGFLVTLPALVPGILLGTTREERARVLSKILPRGGKA